MATVAILKKQKNKTKQKHENINFEVTIVSYDLQVVSV